MTPAEAKKKYKKPYGLRGWGLLVLLVVLSMGMGIWANYADKRLGPYFGVAGAVGMFVALLAEIEVLSPRFVNDRRKMFCDHCNKFLAPDMVWSCGYCDQENREGFGGGHVLLDVCKRCGQSPRSIVCPHCGDQCFLDDEKIAENPARATNAAAVNAESAKATPDQVRAMEIAELEHRKKKAELEAELIQREINVKRLEQTRESLVDKPLRDRLEESLKTYRDRNMGVDEIYRREMERAKKELQNNPEELERHQVTLTSWKDDNIQL